MRLSNVTGLRYPASECCLETNTISPDSEESDRLDIPFGRYRFHFGYVPRAASATRALLRLSPCHRVYRGSSEDDFQALPTSLT